MSRFVILNHDHPFKHWDLLLEVENDCRTWRLLESPATIESRMNAVPIAPHRLLYLDYEGPVSQGRGTVSRWDFGALTWITNEPALCEVIVEGHYWSGQVRLSYVNESLWFRDRSFTPSCNGTSERNSMPQ